MVDIQFSDFTFYWNHILGGGGIAPSSQTVGSLLRTPCRQENCCSSKCISCWIRAVNLLIPNNTIW